MGTSSQIPFSNPAGNNQTNPSIPAGTTKATSIVGAPGQASASSVNNPYTIPAATSTAVSSVGSSSGTVVVNPGSTNSNAAASDQQLTDIYGAGIGGDLNNLLNSIGGTNSATLQEYIQSLAPQEATAQANTNAALGAGGVSANSSVAALADANLSAQEFSSISQESANLTQSGQSLEASILGGTEQAAEAEVASSPFTDLGDVLGGLAKIAGPLMGGIGSLATGGALTALASGNSLGGSGTPIGGFMGSI